MELSIQNIEHLIFYDKNVQQILPDLFPIFQKWTFGIRAGMRKMVKDALLEFLNNVTPEHLDKIGSYLGYPVSIQKLDMRLVKHYNFDVYKLEEKLNACDLQGNVCMSREGDQVYISIWR